MPRKSMRKKSTTNFLATPAEPQTRKPSPSTKSPPAAFEFDFLKERGAAAKPDTSSPGDAMVKKLSSITELNDLASSKLEFVKRHLDRSHAEILKEFEAAESRLNKRLKLQTQGCHQLMDEAEKEYKKMSDRIGEGREAMKDSYSEFITELQASSSRVFKASLPELSQSFGKAIDSLKSRYGIV